MRPSTDVGNQPGAGAIDLRAVLGVGFDCSTVAMLLVDDRSRIRCANAAAEQLLGLRLSEQPSGVIELPEFPLSIGTHSLTIGRGTSGSGRPAQTAEIEFLQVDPVTMSGDHLPSAERFSLVQLRSAEADCRPHADEVVKGYDSATVDPDIRYLQLANSLPGFSVICVDRDMRVVSAAGQALEDAGYRPGTMTGKLFGDALPMLAFERIRSDMESTLAGHDSDADYVSPVTGLEYRLHFRPVRSTDGTVVGCMLVSGEVTADRARQGLLDQVQRLSHVGSCSYDLINGWQADGQLLALLGLDTVEKVVAAVDTVVVPADRDALRSAFAEAVATGHRTTVRYRIVHAQTGMVRHILGAFHAVADADGHLLRAMITHADVSEAVAADELRVRTAQARTELLRRVSDTMEAPSGSVTDTMQKIVDVAAAALGDLVLVRTLTPDGSGVESDLISRPDRDAGNLMSATVLEAVRGWDPGDGVGAVRQSFSTERSSPSTESARPVGEVHVDGRATHPAISHLISAPIRHAGHILGFVRALRISQDNPYLDADADLLQVIADRIGSALAEARVGALLEMHHSIGRAAAAELHKLTLEQRVLFEELAGVEERERMLLAEAIHDEPLQLIVAVMMRMDNSLLAAKSLGGEELEQLVSTLEKAVQKLRTLIIALTPPDLAQGLGVALEQVAAGVFVGKPTVIDAHCLRHVHLTPLRKGNAYRILREALVNVRKHANAGLIELSLEETDGYVVARVRDDGVGTDSLKAAAGHLGMATMYARAASEDGSLYVTSAPGKGTTVTLTLPVNAPDSVESARTRSS